MMAKIMAKEITPIPTPPPYKKGTRDKGCA